MKIGFGLVALTIVWLMTPSLDAGLILLSGNGTMNGGGPGFRYDNMNSQNALDYDPLFSFSLFYDHNLPGTGGGDTRTYAFTTTGQFMIFTSSDGSSNSDYFGTLNNSFIGTITVKNKAAGQKDEVKFELKGDEGTIGTVAFTGDDVWGDDKVKTDSNAGGAGNNDRKFSFKLKGKDMLSSTDLPTGNLNWTESEFGIRWRKGITEGGINVSTVSLKGTATNATFSNVPEPSALLMFGVGLACTAFSSRRRRRI